MLQKRKDFLQIERESVIVTPKSKLIDGLLGFIGPDERQEFTTLCKRVESTIRAWYHVQFEDLHQLYSLFDPLQGAKKLEQLNLTPAKVDVLEQQFLKNLFQVMKKSNFEILNDEEMAIATGGEYLLNMPIAVDQSKLDKKLLSTFFSDNDFDGVPSFANQYVIFRRGIGLDKTTDYFVMSKLDLLIFRTWNWMLQALRVQKPESKKPQLTRTLSRKQSLRKTGIADSGEEDSSLGLKNQDLRVERIHIESMDISFKNLFTENTIQEPTFERMILVYRKVSTPHPINSPLGDRGIQIRHFRNIPMADMELVLPEKKNPGLTPMDWVKLCISAVVGLVALIGSLEVGKVDIWVLIAVFGGIAGYIAKIYFTFQASLVLYQNLITKSLYDKQLDSGRGTLLHLCDDVIQQEIRARAFICKTLELGIKRGKVKEVILAYFVLLSQGKATEGELDMRCEELMARKFLEDCDFEVDDAIIKLEKLNIVTKDANGRYCHQPLKKANDAIGVTTDEIVEQKMNR